MCCVFQVGAVCRQGHGPRALGFGIPARDRDTAEIVHCSTLGLSVRLSIKYLVNTGQTRVAIQIVNWLFKVTGINQSICQGAN